MSFLRILGKIGSVFEKVVPIMTPLEPLIAAVPGGVIFDTIFNAVVSVESQITVANAGPAKKSAVMTIVSAQHPAASQETVSQAIDEIVSAFNALVKLSDDLASAKTVTPTK